MAKIYTHQQIRKSLKKDDFREFISHLVAFGKANAENLLISAIIAGVAIILVPLYFRNQAANESRAQNMLDRATSYYLQPLAADNAYPGQGFKTLTEKYTKAREAFAEAAATYRTTKAARLARMGEGNCWFWAKDYAKALAIYNEERAKSAKDFWGPTLLARIGVCQENLQHWAEAEKDYRDLEAQYPKYFDIRAVRLARARCLTHTGKPDEAKAIFKQEAAGAAGAYWTEWAKSQLAADDVGR